MEFTTWCDCDNCNSRCFKIQSRSMGAVPVLCDRYLQHPMIAVAVTVADAPCERTLRDNMMTTFLGHTDGATKNVLFGIT